jgi:hypothetical protein
VVGLTDGLGVALGIGVTDAPAFGTIGVGVVIGVGEMPGELFRIGWPVGTGLVPGTGCPLGLVVPGWGFPGLVLVCAERNDTATMHAAMMPNNLI